MRRRTSLHPALSIMIVLWTTGCDTADESPSATTSEGSSSAEYGRLLVLIPDQGSMAAVISGVVQVDADGCVLLNQHERKLALVWPSGTSYDSASDVIQLRDGTLVRDGDFVELGGGGVDLEGVRYIIEPDSITPEAEACVELATDTTVIWVIAETAGSTETRPGVEVFPPGVSIDDLP